MESCAKDICIAIENDDTDVVIELVSLYATSNVVELWTIPCGQSDNGIPYHAALCLLYNKGRKEDLFRMLIDRKLITPDCISDDLILTIFEEPLVDYRTILTLLEFIPKDRLVAIRSTSTLWAGNKRDCSILDFFVSFTVNVVKIRERNGIFTKLMEIPEFKKIIIEKGISIETLTKNPFDRSIRDTKSARSQMTMQSSSL